MPALGARHHTAWSLLTRAVIRLRLCSDKNRTTAHLMYTNMKMSGVHAANLKGHVLLLIIWILALAFYIFKVIVSLSWQKAFFQVEKKICGKVPFF